ncbi:type I restriction enzyme HsdR N-terminal domain-containing protein [Nonlabens ponticola]|uniref:Type I restriction enzyme HsdR N-terminal domain-containing protein n=1 Tax=Nonlabens ponticola TaxID=2496866 RepID=A0A3S9MZI6_9FLAO|nr:type I restriction enzyme HsdR N-terminal domain-containing protein [Nonlabens ponticola]AZQ44665.1 type I restriction enzyme HsdR N-terminal domain-containing protein [Nonlabens ponticola]
MEALRLPSAQFRVKSTEKGRLIFDKVRKKFVHLSPEEWVRQHVINWLQEYKRVPLSLINIEKQLIVAGTIKRYDIVVYNKDGSIDTIVECKAPSINISQEVFDQIARYNLITQANYLMITNGLSHYYCQMDYKNEKYSFIEDLPEYVL